MFYGRPCSCSSYISVSRARLLYPTIPTFAKRTASKMTIFLVEPTGREEQQAKNQCDFISFRTFYVYFRDTFRHIRHRTSYARYVLVFGPRTTLPLHNRFITRARYRVPFRGVHRFPSFRPVVAVAVAVSAVE